MVIINGKEMAEKMIEESKAKVEEIKIKYGIVPGLSIIKIGNDIASEVYIKNKILSCKHVGINFKLYEYEENVSQSKIINVIENLNKDTEINAILIQLPLPKHLNKRDIIERILPSKDVDAFTFLNSGRTFLGEHEILPCTPSGIIYMLNKEKIEISGRRAVIVGRSEIVGKPLALALLNNDATITICHTKTNEIDKICREADILICAIGKPNFITKDMVKSGSVVIDVGINKKNFKICGDVDFENVSKKTSYITPVPGGVGPMTVAYLIKNTLTLFINYIKNSYL